MKVPFLPSIQKGTDKDAQIWGLFLNEHPQLIPRPLGCMRSHYGTVNLSGYKAADPISGHPFVAIRTVLSAVPFNAT